MFSFSSFYNHVVLMDISLDIPYKLSYYCMFLLYELTLSLYSIISKVYSSLRSCFYLQLKALSNIGSHRSHGYHLRTDILMMISTTDIFLLISLGKTVFHLLQSPLVLFFRTFCILMKGFSREQQIIHKSYFFFYKLYQM